MPIAKHFSQFHFAPIFLEQYYSLELAEAPIYPLVPLIAECIGSRSSGVREQTPRESIRGCDQAWGSSPSSHTQATARARSLLNSLLNVLGNISCSFNFPLSFLHIANTYSGIQTHKSLYFITQISRRGEGGRRRRLTGAENSSSVSSLVTEITFIRLSAQTCVQIQE